MTIEDEMFLRELEEMERDPQNRALVRGPEQGQQLTEAELQGRVQRERIREQRKFERDLKEWLEWLPQNDPEFHRELVAYTYWLREQNELYEMTWIESIDEVFKAEYGDDQFLRYFDEWQRERDQRRSAKEASWQKEGF